MILPRVEDTGRKRSFPASESGKEFKILELWVTEEGRLTRWRSVRMLTHVGSDTEPWPPYPDYTIQETDLVNVALAVSMALNMLVPNYLTHQVAMT